MSTALHEIDQRTNLTANNKFELLLFRLGDAPGTDQRELFGINVFKIRTGYPKHINFYSSV